MSWTYQYGGVLYDVLVSTFSLLSESPLSEGGGAVTAACVLEQGFSSHTVLSGSASVDLQKQTFLISPLFLMELSNLEMFHKESKLTFSQQSKN